MEFESSVGDLASLLKVEKRRATAMRADSRQVSPTMPGLCASVSDAPGYHILLVHSVITHSFDEVGLATCIMKSTKVQNPQRNKCSAV